MKFFSALFCLVSLLPPRLSGQEPSAGVFSLPAVKAPQDTVYSCPGFVGFQKLSEYPAIEKTLKDVHEINPSLLPDFSDDMSPESRLAALRANISYWRSKPDSFKVKIGNRFFGARQLEKTSERMLDIFSSRDGRKRINEVLRKEFHIFTSVADDGSDEIIVTGYYEAEIPVSKTHGDGQAIHLKPANLIKIPPEAGVDFKWGRLDENGNVSRHFSTEEIRSGKLDGQNLEIAWSRHPAQIMLLQIQGSGVLKFPDGSSVKVGFDGANGWPFKSVQKILTDCGEVPPMNFRDFIKYLALQPAGRELMLVSLNPRYIFFKINPPDSNPFGAIGSELIPGRSVAVDTEYVPYGLPGLMISEKPVAGENGEIAQFRKFKRFVATHDTGSTIRGPGRVDLFWGFGEKAEIESSSMKAPGNLYLFALKN